MLKLFLKIALSLLGLYLLFALSLKIYLEVACREPARIQFSSDKWKKAEPGSMERYAMLNDLTARHKLTGMKEEELVSLLGSGDKNGGRGTLYYSLGPERPCMAVDNRWLVITLESGVARNYDIGYD